MLPFLVGEEVAKFAEPVGNGLVRAHGLRGIDIIDGPLETLSHGIEPIGSYGCK